MRATYTVDEVASLLQLSRYTVYDLIRRGELPALRIGRSLRVDAATLERYARGASRAAPAVEREPVVGEHQLLLEGRSRVLLQVPADLEALPSSTVAAAYTACSGFDQHAFSGVLLYPLLCQVGLVEDSPDCDEALTTYLVAEGADGYRVVLSLGELAPAFGRAPVLVAWRRDGLPIGPDHGPLQLVVPSDNRVSRYVRRLRRVRVRSIGPG